MCHLCPRCTSRPIGWGVGVVAATRHDGARTDAGVKDDLSHRRGREHRKCDGQCIAVVIPIVFVHVADPVGSGFVHSLARPGRNLTGVLLFESGIVGKWLAMLKEVAPRLGRAALVFNPKTAPFYEYYRGSAATAASSLGIDLMLNPIENATNDIERSLELFARVPHSGLVVLPDVTNVVHRDLIVALAARFGLPAVYSLRSFVSAGGLMAYSTDRIVQIRQAASYVDRILRGANPADLPVLAPTKYETVLNLNTAKALGLTVPPGLLLAADEVIE
jgi:ABC-type uncharacterized transport system substrate-binding protein